MLAQQNNLTPECLANGTECQDSRVQEIYLLFAILRRTRARPQKITEVAKWAHTLNKGLLAQTLQQA